MSTKGKGKAKPKAKGHKAMTKAQMAGEVAARTGLTKTQVQDVFATQAAIVGEELKGGRPVAIPGLVKITLKRRAATPARPGINPFTKEAIMIKAKPARNVVRVRALKGLRDMA
jgi:nucleoid DNA-binding protein